PWSITIRSFTEPAWTQHVATTAFDHFSLNVPSHWMTSSSVLNTRYGDSRILLMAASISPTHPGQRAPRASTNNASLSEIGILHKAHNTDGALSATFDATTLTSEW